MTAAGYFLKTSGLSTSFFVAVGEDIFIVSPGMRQNSVEWNPGRMKLAQLKCRRVYQAHDISTLAASQQEGRSKTQMVQRFERELED